MKIKLESIVKYDENVQLVIAEIEKPSKVHYLNGEKAFNVNNDDLII